MNNSEKILNYTENEIIGKESIRRAVIAAQPERKGFAWKRALAAAAACLAALVITMLAIPSARAEVFSWIAPRKPFEHHIAIASIDELISGVSTKNAEAVTPGTITSNRVSFVSDDAIWNEIADDFNIKLGKTTVNGEGMFLDLKLSGLAALPVIDASSGGNATRTVIPAEALPAIFQDGNVPEEYRDGSVKFTEPAECRIRLVLEDGTELNCLGLDTVPYDAAAEPLYERLNEIASRCKEEWMTTDEERESMSNIAIEWLKNNLLSCTVRFELKELQYVDYGGYADPAEFFAEHADENGMIKAKVFYTAEALYPEYEKKLEVSLGTACFDARALLNADARILEAGLPGVLSGGRQIVTSAEWIEASGERSFSLTNWDPELAGVEFSALPGASVNGFGASGVKIKVKRPEDLPSGQCEAFILCLRFYAEACGSRYQTAVLERKAVNGHEYVFTLSYIPISPDGVQEISEIKLIPALRHIDAVRLEDGSVLEVPFGKALIMPIPGVAFEESAETELAEGAFLLTVQD